MKNSSGYFRREKTNVFFEKLGFFLLLLLVLGHLIIACNFYFLGTIKIPRFFYLQANKNEYFEPGKRY